ncbi:hypothetical protein Bbelb_323880 [Branchiostoma belcheri]|nr:hypothetical protein Bbelb_323880 [Branchiostoma belcheri]
MDQESSRQKLVSNPWLIARRRRCNAYKSDPICQEYHRHHQCSGGLQDNNMDLLFLLPRLATISLKRNVVKKRNGKVHQRVTYDDAIHKECPLKCGGIIYVLEECTLTSSAWLWWTEVK